MSWKWLFWELSAVYILGKMLPKPAFCYPLWNHWEYPKFTVWFISITLVWDTSMEAWKGREGCLSKFSHFSNHFLFVLFCFSKCVKCLPCVRNFYSTPFQEIVVTSKWQSCWTCKCFISFYSYDNPVRYKFANLEVEDQNESGRGKRTDISWVPVTEFRRCFPSFLFLLIMLQRITLKWKHFIMQKQLSNLLINTDMVWNYPVFL